jgi:hypothetical protein
MRRKRKKRPGASIVDRWGVVELVVYGMRDWKWKWRGNHLLQLGKADTWFPLGCRYEKENCISTNSTTKAQYDTPNGTPHTLPDTPTRAPDDLAQRRAIKVFRVHMDNHIRCGGFGGPDALAGGPCAGVQERTAAVRSSWSAGWLGGRGMGREERENGGSKWC